MYSYIHGCYGIAYQDKPPLAPPKSFSISLVTL